MILTVFILALSVALLCGGILAWLCAKFHGEMLHLAKIVDFEKGRADDILKELHKVQGEAESQFKQDRAYIEELQAKIKKAKEQTELAWAQVNTEVEIRVSFQNKVHSLEEAYSGMRSLVASRDAEIAVLDNRIDRWMTVYNELLKKASASIQKRDANGRYVKKSA